mmetsp:Transcript_24989/g.51945  ORF Transcript_24989/g.51945 Transcript_24989/m.51945 type:complete len:475 (-) Transcript_24989:228-1652(-)|eukprot:CAMPEP_0172445176 /NCGR_PEP_ID=MMETSP1065-20121228/5091_1 /TAXON_ID=265537 /ORGANISM="Amphiprora paludosa, Strain CCMP125" /LENGTH=474 /DNA_ID=CAMNT_0013195975 /DNA_START=162 /DNA_END=1586 /DNA_ORIENTATION=-
MVDSLLFAIQNAAADELHRGTWDPAREGEIEEESKCDQQPFPLHVTVLEPVPNGKPRSYESEEQAPELVFLKTVMDQLPAFIEQEAQLLAGVPQDMQEQFEENLGCYSASATGEENPKDEMQHEASTRTYSWEGEEKSDKCTAIFDEVHSPRSVIPHEKDTLLSGEDDYSVGNVGEDVDSTQWNKRALFVPVLSQDEKSEAPTWTRLSGAQVDVFHIGDIDETEEELDPALNDEKPVVQAGFQNSKRSESFEAEDPEQFENEFDPYPELEYLKTLYGEFEETWEDEFDIQLEYLFGSSLSTHAQNKELKFESTNAQQLQEERNNLADAPELVFIKEMSDKLPNMVSEELNILAGFPQDMIHELKENLHPNMMESFNISSTAPAIPVRKNSGDEHCHHEAKNAATSDDAVIAEDREEIVASYGPDASFQEQETDSFPSPFLCYSESSCQCMPDDYYSMIRLPLITIDEGKEDADV